VEATNGSPKEITVATWLIVLIAALIALVIGFGTAAKWLFIIALVLLVVGLFGLARGRSWRA
jgi:uncharacterized membrane protein YtjA (UPF0391 family)